MLLEDLRDLWGGGDELGGKAGGGGRSTPTLAAVADTVETDEPVRAVRPAYRGTGPMKLLVLVDGSPASKRAVEIAILMAKAVPEGSLVLLNAQTAAEVGSAGMTDVVMTRHLEDQVIDRAADIALKPAVQLCRDSGVPFETRKQRGRFADVVAQVAVDETVDHIVMTSDDEGGGFGFFNAPDRARSCARSISLSRW